MPKSKNPILFILLWSTILAALLINLDISKVWWDEGWTLDVARNWVENDHFGHYLNGEEIPPRIPVRFPVVLPIALSFKLFGVGIWQGRLPGAIFTIVTMLLLFYLATQLYNKRIAYANILILSLMSLPELNPLFIGRQVLAEMPMLFYLLGGYFFFWLALTKSTSHIFPASILWGISLISKFQVLPFWLVSVGLMLLFSILLNNWRVVTLLVFAFIGTIIVAVSISQIQTLIMPSSFEDKPVWDLLINSIIFVFDWPVRLRAITLIVAIGIPSILGFTHAFNQILTFVHHENRVNRANKFEQTTPLQGKFQSTTDMVFFRQTMIIGLWGLSVSWFGWYVLLGMSWPRYLFPAYFLGSIFVAVFLDSATNGFNLSSTILNASSIILKKQISKQTGYAMAAVLTIGVSLVLTFYQFYYSLNTRRYSFEPIVEYITNNIADEKMIETFESELFFVAPHKYHFPSDYVSMELIRRKEIDPTQTISYDPLKSDTDYLIIGDYESMWKLYSEILDNGSFSLIAAFEPFQIYQRIRN